MRPPPGIALQGARAGGADGHARAVVEDDVERFDIVDDFAAEQAVDAATVVADHAAEGAARVRCRVGGVGEVMQLGGVAEAVENDARLDTAPASPRGRCASRRFMKRE